MGKAYEFIACLFSSKSPEYFPVCLSVWDMSNCKNLNTLLRINAQLTCLGCSHDFFYRIKELKYIRKIVHTQIRMKADEYLSSLRSKHSKTEHLISYSFQKYLLSDNLSTDQQKLLFHLRTRSTQTKNNYQNKYKFDMSCRYCKNKQSEESDSHLLKCPVIVNSLQNLTNLNTVKYEDIFAEESKQVEVTKVYQAIFKFLKSKFDVWKKKEIPLVGPCSMDYWLVILVLCLRDIYSIL